MGRHLFSEDYHGSRWTYGLDRRPQSIGTQPDGFLIGSQVATDTFRYGTLDYPFPLTPAQVESFELKFAGATLTAEDVDKHVLYPNENCWKEGNFIIVQYADKPDLWKLNLVPLPDRVVPLYRLTPVPLFRGMVHLEGMHSI